LLHSAVIISIRLLTFGSSVQYRTTCNWISLRD